MTYLERCIESEGQLRMRSARASLGTWVRLYEEEVVR